jgi:hypothetical protein
MIRLLGQGWLYEIEHNRAYYLARTQRKRAMILVILLSIAITILLWTCRL